MPTFTSFDGIAIVYDSEGTGPPVVLVHGFAADAAVNWHRPGVVAALVAAGHRVVTPDARGHGRSGKPYDVDAYRDDAMARDVVHLLDHLDVEQVDLVGYSMGAAVSARVATSERRLRRLVLGGVGAGIAARSRAGRREEIIVGGLLAHDPSGVEDPTARAFCHFADVTGADKEALAAVMLAGLGEVSLGSIAVPTLVAAGVDDLLAGTPQALADLIPGAEAVTVAGDHLTVVADPRFASTIVEFLGR